VGRVAGVADRHARAACTAAAAEADVDTAAVTTTATPRAGVGTTMDVRR
jgi:hypothetical protein